MRNLSRFQSGVLPLRIPWTVSPLPSKPVPGVVVLPSQFQSVGVEVVLLDVGLGNGQLAARVLGPARVGAAVIGGVGPKVDPEGLGQLGLVHIGHVVARVVEHLDAAAEDALGLVGVAHHRRKVRLAVDAVIVAFAAAVIEAERVAELVHERAGLLVLVAGAAGPSAERHHEPQLVGQCETRRVVVDRRARPRVLRDHRGRDRVVETRQSARRHEIVLEQRIEIRLLVAVIAVAGQEILGPGDLLRPGQRPPRGTPWAQRAVRTGVDNQRDTCPGRPAMDDRVLVERADRRVDRRLPELLVVTGIFHPIQLNQNVGPVQHDAHRREIHELGRVPAARVDGDAALLPVGRDPVTRRVAPELGGPVLDCPKMYEGVALRRRLVKRVGANKRVVIVQAHLRTVVEPVRHVELGSRRDAARRRCDVHRLVDRDRQRRLVDPAPAVQGATGPRQDRVGVIRHMHPDIEGGRRRRGDHGRRDQCEPHQKRCD